MAIKAPSEDVFAFVHSRKSSLPRPSLSDPVQVRYIMCHKHKERGKPGGSTPSGTVQPKAAKYAVAILQDLAKAFDKLLLDLCWCIHVQRMLSSPQHIE